LNSEPDEMMSDANPHPPLPDSQFEGLAVNIAGIHMKNPIMTASGTFGYGEEFASLVNLNRLGAIIVKGISLNPSPGNPPPRTVETSGGMLNAIGLENIGLDAFVREKLPFLKKLSPPLILNIYGDQAEAYGELAARIGETEGIAGIEINISCPNVKAGGIAFGTNPKTAFELVETVRKRTDLPLIVKLSPNVTDIAIMARSVEEAGADAVSLINTITAMAVDIYTKKPKLHNITGGLSGPAIKPIALRMVWEVAQTVEVPVIGIGGIADVEDVLEFMIVGACAIQVGTANFINPRATTEIIDGLSRYVAENSIDDIGRIVGTLQTSKV
jgi:dihydroorotate dehydrogenase (NAD+) catalytic subunit